MTSQLSDSELTGQWEQANQAYDGFYGSLEEPCGEKEAAGKVIDAGLTHWHRLNRLISTANDPDTLKLGHAITALRLSLHQREQTVDGFIEEAAQAYRQTKRTD